MHSLSKTATLETPPFRPARISSASHAENAASSATISSNRDPVTAAAAADSAHFADLAHSALVLGLVLGAVEGTRDARLAGVDGRVARTADVELGKSVEFNVDGVSGRALSNGLELAGLFDRSVIVLVVWDVVVLTVSLNLALVPRSISAFAKWSTLPSCLFLLAKFMAENHARVWC